MAKVNFWKVLGILGTLSEELSYALEDNGKISAFEAINISKTLIDKLDIPSEKYSFKKLEFSIEIIDTILTDTKDGKLTVHELIDLGEKICTKFGIDLDKSGIEVPTI